MNKSLLTNTVIQGDCLEYMKTLPDNSIDLVLTDPPYGIGIKNKVWWWTKKAPSKTFVDVDEWDKFIPTKEYFEEIKRISSNAIIFWWNYFIEYLENSPCWLIWDKRWNIIPPRTFADCEIARTNFNKPTRKFEFIWDGFIQWDMKNKEIRKHPTQKPVPLFRWILENYSEPWMTILDPFAWSWTTWIACKELWRKYILIEKEPKYVEIINKRLSNTTVSLFH